jgi:hypothetical protein
LDFPGFALFSCWFVSDFDIRISDFAAIGLFLLCALAEARRELGTRESSPGD